MKKYFLIFAFIALTPSIASAAWWNPLSWGIFSSILQDSSPKQTEVITAHPTNNLIATSTDQFATTTTQANISISSTTKTSPVVNTSKTDSKTVKSVVKKPQQTQPTGDLCNGTYWNACPTGQKMICPQTGNAYCQLPVQQPPIVPATTTLTTTPIATTTVDKGTPYKGQDGNWYYPNAYDANGKTLQVIVPDPKVIVTINPSSVDYGGTATLSWTANGATSCTLNSSPVLLAPTGSQTTGTLSTSTTYTVSCTDKDGTASSSVTVNVPQSSINYAAAAKDCYVGGGTLYSQFPCLDERNYAGILPSNIFPYSSSQFDGLPPPF